MFAEFLNEIQIYINEKVISEFNYLVIIGGLLLIYFIYMYFSDNSSVDKSSVDKSSVDKSSVTESVNEGVLRCMQKYNINEIYEFPNLLSHEECDKIIEISKPFLKKSTVIGAITSNDISSERTSSNAFISPNIDPVISKIDNIVHSIIGIDIDNYEKLQVVNYTPGQLYNAHWDACDPLKDERCHSDVKKGGLRFATFIIYLNDDMEGGQTEFPLINKRIEPQKGKGVLFFNLNEDLKGRRELSKHAGLPPTKGEKWMCNKWIRLGKSPV